MLPADTMIAALCRTIRRLPAALLRGAAVGLAFATAGCAAGGVDSLADPRAGAGSELAFVPMGNSVLLSQPVAISAPALERALSRADPAARIEVASENRVGNKAFVVLWNDIPFLVIAVDEPLPAASFAGHLSFAGDDAGVREIQSTHKARVTVTPLRRTGQHLEALRHGIGVMEISSAVASLGKPVAHMWSPSNNVTTAGAFDEDLARLEQSRKNDLLVNAAAAAGYPLTHWILVVPVADRARGGFGAVTAGLQAFAGHEIVVKPNAASRGRATLIAYTAAAYVFARGPIYSSGETSDLGQLGLFRITRRPARDKRPAVVEIEEVR